MARKKLNIESNPFEPSGSGAPLLQGAFWFPAKWQDEVRKKISELDSGKGRRAVAVIGQYGSGKSYVLRWLERVELPTRSILPYYFENPEVKFYDLANSLLRRVGRKHFSKLVFELASPHMEREYKTLFLSGFDAFLERCSVRVSNQVLTELTEAIKKADLADDEQIAHCLARIVADTGRKPYFEYRDFVTTKTGNYVAEKQEPKYFNAVLEVLRRGDNVERIAFLVDEFEQVSLQHKLSRKDAQDYFVTLKRLLEVMEQGDFWLILAMTPDAWDRTKSLDPAFCERCYEFEVPALEKADAIALIKHRFGTKPPPFEANFIDALRPTTFGIPRALG